MGEAAELMYHLRQLFKHRRQAFSFLDKHHNRLAPPKWMPDTDGLHKLYQSQQLLFGQGHVVFGTIVQANTLLFERGKDDCPANLIFSLDSYFDEHLDELGQIATETYLLKENKTHQRNLDAVGLLLANETKREFNRKLPVVLTGGREVYLTTVMIHRKHLPMRRLIGSWLLLLVLPEFTQYAIVLPGRYWGREMTAQWLAVE